MNVVKYYYLCGEGFFVVAFFLREIKSGKGAAAWRKCLCQYYREEKYESQNHNGLQ